MTRKRRLVSIFAITLVILAFVAWTARARIGMALFDRVVEANVGIDRSAALPDGLHAVRVVDVEFGRLLLVGEREERLAAVRPLPLEKPNL